jgi:hypothetical protein
MILISCEKDDSVETSNECTKTVNRYLANGGLHSWNIYYYENDNLIKKEYSFGDIELYEYDNSNNLVRSEFHSTDFNNNTIKLYSENQIQFVYVISNYGDTTYWETYNYENELLTHMESIDCNSYYFYGQEMDSVITTYKNGLLKEKLFKKTETNNLIYQARYRYDSYGEIDYYFIDNYEYSNNLLMREIHEHWNFGFTDMYTYEEFKYIYENGLLVKRETYDEPGELYMYEVYSYNDDDSLIRHDYFQYNGTLFSYDIIEYNCN